jgi:hypothetical protein
MATLTDLISKAEIPTSIYVAVGFLIITNLGTIVTVIGAAFKIVYNYAVLETTTKALHKRLDSIEDRINKEGE